MADHEAPESSSHTSEERDARNRELVSANEGLRQAWGFVSSVLESIPIPLVVAERDRTVRMVNSAFCDLTGMQASELMGRSLPELVHRLWGVDRFSEELGRLADAESDSSLAFEHESTTARHLTLSIRGRSLGTGGSRVVLLTMEDITLRRMAEQLAAQENIDLGKEVERTGLTLTHARDELRSLAAHQMAAQEEERRHIARELHDDLAQRLSALGMEFDAARKEKDEKVRSKALESIRAHIDSLNTEVRNLSHRLHPVILEDLGLSAALRALVDDFREREGMPASYTGVDHPDKIPQKAATALYRITQEALRNVAKHAGKTHVKVMLQAEDHLVRLEVRDSGTGFDQETRTPRQGLGIVSMKERARIAGGTFAVTSRLGDGTTVSVEVPAGA